MIRKRCRHGAGLTGAGKRRAWRSCGCVWGVDLYIDGVRVWHNLGTDEAVAEVAELRFRADLLEGRRPTVRATAGFREIAADWYAHRRADPDARASSIAGYRSRIDHATRYLGDIPVADLTQDHLRGLARGLLETRAPNTVRGVLFVVSSVIGHAVKMGAPRPNVVFGDLVPTQGARTPHHTVTELRQVITHLQEPWASMAETALLTGLRRGELLALEVPDFDGDTLRVDENLQVDGSIGPPKTRNGYRLVRLSPRAVEVVAERVGVVGSGRLWPGTIAQADYAMAEAMDAAGCRRGGRLWHSFRHAHTAVLNEAGVSLRDSAARLGHGSNYAQSLSYGWAAEHADVAGLDGVVRRHGPSS